MTIVLVFLSVLVAAGALTISILSYLARNRPYVGVKELEATNHLEGDYKELAIQVQNVGEIPAVDVTLSVSDLGGEIDVGDIFLGPVFAHTTVLIRRPVLDSFTYSPDKDQSHLEPVSEERRGRFGGGDNVQEYIQVYPETADATMVTCKITYKAPGFWDRTFTSVQPFRVYHDGRAEPAQSQQGRIT